MARLLKIIAFFIILSQCISAFALTYSDTNEALSDVFSFATADDNAGLSTFYSLNIPSGARAESLGGAYTGLSNDISYFDYNPAASCILDETEIAVFHNAWIADSALETLAATTRFGDLGIGGAVKCFYVPFTEYDYYGEKQTDGYYSETTGVLNVSYNFMHGYYFKGIAVGANIKGAWRAMPDYMNDDTGEKKEGLSQSAAALMADFGVLTRFNFLKFFQSREANCAVGVNIKNIGAAFTGFGSSIEKDDSIASVLSVGFSYQPFEAFTFTADFNQPVNLFSPSDSEKYSLACGMIFQLAKPFALLTGLLLKGGNPRVSLGGEAVYRSVQVNLNYTLDLTTSFNPVNHISLSAKVKLGDRGRAEIARKVDEWYIDGLQKYTEGDYEGAIESWNKSLLLNAGFDPAKKGIAIALRQQQLVEKIKEMQSLD